jgi:hypothetical protein
MAVTATSGLTIRFGYSVLAETIQAGKDPHCYNASLWVVCEHEEFLEMESGSPTRFKHERQAAKSVDSGVLGAESSLTTPIEIP